ncbi:MAG TPA: sulfate permease, partial [Gemmatimonadaceae bacterium]|nr:sulfate permease [Gemmatimonadaceae bacterium]
SSFIVQKLRADVPPFAVDFLPKSIVCLREGYSREGVTRDVIAGIVVGVVALPLALAFAIASGVPPERGLYTAIVAGFLISLLGGSRVQIGGPTGAFVVIVYGIVTKYGYEGLVIITVLAGAFLVVLGLARMGGLIKFIPYPVVTGFTSGIAVIIFSSQIKDFFGLKMGAVPAEFMDKWVAYWEKIGTIHLPTTLLAIGTLVILLVWPKFSKMVPGPFVAMVVATLAVQLFDLPVETIGSRFGGVPSSLPRPHWPDIPWHQMREFISPALTVALLAAIESLLSAVVADGMIGTRHKSNMELIGQGVANIVSPVFGGIPATGAIARTATNVKNGGRTPVAGMTHAVVLLLITLFFGKLAALIPMATLAAILVVVAYHMSEWRTFLDELRGPRADVAVLVTAFVLTVVVDLTVAIEVGMVLASFLFMHRMAAVTNVSAVTRELQREAAGDDERDPNAVSTYAIPPGVDIYEINGAFFFGAAETFKDTVNQVARKPKVLIIRMRNVSLLDATGLRALRDVAHRSRQDRTLVLIAEIHTQPLAALERSPLREELGDEAIFLTLDDALDRARRYLAVRTPTPPTGTPAAGHR